MTFAKDYPGAIGIDLGTTYSCVAAAIDSRVEVIANEQGNRTTPSYVAFSHDGEKLVGDAAKNQAAQNPANTIFDAKRLIGRRYTDSTVKSDICLWPFEVVNKNDAPFINIKTDKCEKEYEPQEISAMVLQRMKEIAEMKLGMNVTKAVITVPAYFSDSQRQATKDAGALAGLEVLRIINEPTAAAIAYGLDQRNKEAAGQCEKKERTVLIFDLGGGTFDVSLLNIAGGVFTVLATSGDTHLGGEDFDNHMVNHFVEDFKKRHGHEHCIEKDGRSMRRLRTACEHAKRSLSTLTKSTVEIDALYAGVDFSANITRAKFEGLNSAKFMKTLDAVKEVLKEAKIEKSKVDDIVLVGGSTRIPKIQSLLAEFFEIPVEKLNKSINPDEAVAYGAAVQGAVLTGTAAETTGDLLLLDVVPLSLGVQLESGIMGVVVPRNTPIPTIKRRVFTTVHDNQTTVEFPIYEGERAHCKENNLLGEFTLSGLPAVPRGAPELETIFEIDANGLLKVTAIERNSNKTAHVSISNKPGRMTNDDIQRLISEAEANKDNDAELTAKVEAKQGLKEYIYNAESTLRDATLASRLKSTDKVITELSEALEWLEINSDTVKAAEISSRHRRLEAVVNRAYSTIYAQGGSENQRRGTRNRRH